MAIKPVAWRGYPDGHAEFVLTQDDYEKIRQGYGCSHCLEDYNGKFHVWCPVCGQSAFEAFELHPNDTSFVINK